MESTGTMETMEACRLLSLDFFSLVRRSRRHMSGRRDALCFAAALPMLPTNQILFGLLLVSNGSLVLNDLLSLNGLHI
jgi:hypothetical protein